MDGILDYLEGRLLAQKQLHQVQAWQKAHGISTEEIGKFVQETEKLAPVVLQSAEVLLEDAAKAKTVYDVYHAAGLAALGVTPK